MPALQLNRDRYQNKQKLAHQERKSASITTSSSPMIDDDRNMAANAAAVVQKLFRLLTLARASAIEAQQAQLHGVKLNVTVAYKLYSLSEDVYLSLIQELVCVLDESVPSQKLKPLAALKVLSRHLILSLTTSKQQDPSGLVVFLLGCFAVLQLIPTAEVAELNEGGVLKKLLPEVIAPGITLAFQAKGAAAGLAVDVLPSFFEWLAKNRVSWAWRVIVKAILAELRDLLQLTMSLDDSEILVDAVRVMLTSHPEVATSLSLVRLGILPVFTLACEHSQLQSAFKKLLQQVADWISLMISGANYSKEGKITAIACRDLLHHLQLVFQLSIDPSTHIRRKSAEEDEEASTESLDCVFPVNASSELFAWILSYLSYPALAQRLVRHLLLPICLVWIWKRPDDMSNTLPNLLRSLYNHSVHDQTGCREVRLAIEEWVQSHLAVDPATLPESLLNCVAFIAGILQDFEPTTSTKLVCLAREQLSTELMQLLGRSLAQRSLNIDCWPAKSRPSRRPHVDVDHTFIKSGSARRSQITSCSMSPNNVHPSPYRFVLTLFDLMTGTTDFSVTAPVLPTFANKHQQLLFRYWIAAITHHCNVCPLISLESRTRFVESVRKRLAGTLLSNAHDRLAAMHCLLGYVSALPRLTEHEAHGIKQILRQFLTDADHQVRSEAIQECFLFTSKDDVEPSVGYLFKEIMASQSSSTLPPNLSSPNSTTKRSDSNSSFGMINDRVSTRRSDHEPFTIRIPWQSATRTSDKVMYRNTSQERVVQIPIDDVLSVGSAESHHVPLELNMHKHRSTVAPLLAINLPFDELLDDYFVDEIADSFLQVVHADAALAKQDLFSRKHHSEHLIPSMPIDIPPSPPMEEGEAEDSFKPNGFGSSFDDMFAVNAPKTTRQKQLDVIESLAYNELSRSKRVGSLNAIIKVVGEHETDLLLKFANVPDDHVPTQEELLPPLTDLSRIFDRLEEELKTPLTLEQAVILTRDQVALRHPSLEQLPVLQNNDAENDIVFNLVDTLSKHLTQQDITRLRGLLHTHSGQ